MEGLSLWNLSRIWLIPRIFIPTIQALLVVPGPDAPQLPTGIDMYISRGLDSQPSSAASFKTAAIATATHQDDLQKLQQLIVRSTSTGILDRQDESAILAALAKPPRYSIEKCELFRQLQERVWQAELHLAK